MAKYEKVDEEILNVFNDVLENTTIPNWISFELRSNLKQKDVCVIRKNNDLYEELIDGLNFVIIINEEIFENLDVDAQKIVFSEILTGVTISEHDVVGYSKPNFTTYRSVLEKFGHEKIIIVKESIESLFEEKKQREDEEKMNKKKKK